MLHLRRAAPLLRRAPPPPRRLRHAALASALGTDRQRWGLGAALALGGVGVGAVGAQPAEAAAFTSETAKAANRRAAEKADDRRRRDVSNLPNSEVAAATYNTTHWRSHANDPWEGAPTSVLWGREQVGTADLRLDAQVNIPVAEVAKLPPRLDQAADGLRAAMTMEEAGALIDDHAHLDQRNCPSNARGIQLGFVRAPFAPATAAAAG